MPGTAVTFGEIMLRLSAPAHERLEQANCFIVTPAGAEANVAASLASFGVPVQFVTRLPVNELGRKCASSLTQRGVGIDQVLWGGERLGVFYLEAGAAQRASKVVYDRRHSSFSTVQPGMIDWSRVLTGATWFHFTGITPAVSRSAAEACLEAATIARSMNVTVSCDLNFRSKLWQWGRSAGEVMEELVRRSDLVIANEEDAEKVFGIMARDTDVAQGQVDAHQYVGVCESLAERFPQLQSIAFTLRGSLSASHNTWSGLLWHEGKTYMAPTYDILPIVDRVGAGDAFNGALIYGLGFAQNGPQWSLEFAVAASCLKHSIHGDFNLVTLAEVERLVEGNASGRVVR